jgi:hypothetical protein
VEKSQITIQDDEEDFVPKKPSVKPDKENKKCHEDAKTSAGKKITEKKIETNLNEKENGHSSKLDNVDKVKKISSKKVITVKLLCKGRQSFLRSMFSQTFFELLNSED